MDDFCPHFKKFSLYNFQFTWKNFSLKLWKYQLSIFNITLFYSIFTVISSGSAKCYSSNEFTNSILNYSSSVCGLCRIQFNFNEYDATANAIDNVCRNCIMGHLSLTIVNKIIDTHWLWDYSEFIILLFQSIHYSPVYILYIFCI